MPRDAATRFRHRSSVGTEPAPTTYARQPFAIDGTESGRSGESMWSGMRTLLSGLGERLRLLRASAKHAQPQAGQVGMFYELLFYVVSFYINFVGRESFRPSRSTEVSLPLSTTALALSSSAASDASIMLFAGLCCLRRVTDRDLFKLLSLLAARCHHNNERRSLCHDARDYYLKHNRLNRQEPVLQVAARCRPL